MSNITTINHASLIVSDTSRALEFYEQVLGLPVDE
ncbi:MAG: VOC family protein, partial [Thiohalophilus sp.]